MWFTAPKNFKSGRLLSNKFTYIDLAVMVLGMILSIVLISIFIIYFLQDSVFLNMVFVLLFTLPGILSFALVQPNGIYHNFYTFFYLLFIDIASVKEYVWGGLMRNEYKENEESNDID